MKEVEQRECPQTHVCVYTWDTLHLDEQEDETEVIYMLDRREMCFSDDDGPVQRQLLAFSLLFATHRSVQLRESTEFSIGLFTYENFHI